MIAWLDAGSGVSGDKFLAALLDLGARTGHFGLDDVRVAIESLGLEGIALDTRDVVRGGLRGLYLDVDVVADQPHRHWRDIRATLACADLPGATVERALAAFEVLALAEAKVHGTTVEAVHFHEVGAADSILDVVGVSLGLELLGIERLVVSPLAVGEGSVMTAHGMLPVPAPATLEVLGDAPLLTGGPSELTTPTGAALAVSNATDFGGLPPMRASAVGYGAGTRDVPGLPNVLRVVLGEPLAAEPATLSTEQVAVLETNIDHLTPEAAAITVEQLLAEGALDAWTSPIVMKKGRSAFTLSVLAPAEGTERMAGIVVTLTGSLGVRRTDLERLVAPREELRVETPYGSVRFKVGAGFVRPEADDVARIAREQSRAFADVAHELSRYASS